MGANAPERPVRAVIAAGSRLSLQAMGSLLELEDSQQVQVVGGALDLLRLEVAVQQHLPDVVLICLPLEGLDRPVELLHPRQAAPELGIAVLVEGAEEGRGLLPLAGVAGVALLTGAAAPRDVTRALLMVRKGFTVVCPEFGKIAETGDGLASLPAPEVVLAEKERAVLVGLAEGVPEAKIGASLGMSPRTVQNHLLRARRKPGARDRTHAVALALRRGLLDGVNESPLGSPRGCALRHRGDPRQAAQERENRSGEASR